MFDIFTDRSKIVRLFSSLGIALLSAHLLTAYVFFPEAPVVRPQFWQKLQTVSLSIPSLSLPQGIAIRLPTLPNFLAQNPAGSRKENGGRLVPPATFVPPPEWRVSEENSPAPTTSGGDYQPANPTATPVSGGGVPSSTPIPGGTNPSPTITAFPPTRTPTPTQTSGGGSAPSGDAATLLGLINDERQRQGIRKLSFDNRLNRAAQKYANVIGPARDCSHSHGSEFWDRFRTEGYSQYGGENITCGISSAQAAFNAWMNSPNHKSNMLNDSWKSAGLGFSSGYWVLDMGPQ